VGFFVKNHVDPPSPSAWQPGPSLLARNNGRRQNHHVAATSTIRPGQVSTPNHPHPSDRPERPLRPGPGDKGALSPQSSSEEIPHSPCNPSEYPYRRCKAGPLEPVLINLCLFGCIHTAKSREQYGMYRSGSLDATH